MIDFLIGIGCDVNAQDRMGSTPLLIALEEHNFSVTSTILSEAKVNVFISDNKGMNIFKIILKFGEDRKLFINLFTEAIQDYDSKAKELASIMMEAGWPIHYAILIESYELIKFMLEAGCDVNTRDKHTNYLTALHEAVLIGDVKTTKILLEYGADIDITHEGLNSPFKVAITYHSHIYDNIFETFLEHKLTLERFNTDGAIESYACFSRACGQIIKLLLKYKINLTKKDKYGITLLHALVSNRSREVINLILESEIDANIKDNHGNTPLHRAVELSNIKCIKALLNKGADVHADNKIGYTPLIRAITNHAKEEEIDILMKYGKSLDERMQNILLNIIELTNIPISNVSSILKRLAIIYFQTGALSKRNLDMIKKNANMDSAFASYSQELNSMKQNKITDSSHISVLDILCASEQKLINLARNKEMVDNFLKIDVRSKYLIFGELVKKRFESACSKQDLVQNAVNVLNDNIEQLNFNVLVAENIVKYLNQDDLVSLQMKA